MKRCERISKDIKRYQKIVQKISKAFNRFQKATVCYSQAQHLSTRDIAWRSKVGDAWAAGLKAGSSPEHASMISVLAAPGKRCKSVSSTEHLTSSSWSSWLALAMVAISPRTCWHRTVSDLSNGRTKCGETMNKNYIKH